MNAFSAFRFATRTVLHPHSARFPPCLALQPRTQLRFKSKRKIMADNRPRNEAIPYEDVYVVDEDNVLVRMSLKRLLHTIDHNKEFVQLVDAKPQPVVKILNKKEYIIKLKAVRGRQRESARKNTTKEVQLTWGSEQSDLEHKLARVRSYLEIGAKVDVVFATKPNGTPPSMDVMQRKLKDTVEMMADISREWKPVEWRRNMAAIFLQGIKDPNRKLTPEQVQLVEEEAAADEDAEDSEEDEDASEEAETPLPPPQVVSRPAEPVKPKADPVPTLAELGFIPPPVRRNPLLAMKKEKKYGTRKYRPP
ncbi:hypothetical protein DFH07DRAFT_813345 [Mycena maculata]|uniref:Translation initiation factor 3 N-terminal domain-containing protein n=1 Tax=Mycena maculata TaxID=230809 RepID=A0AAD7JDR2_9AGAR|nr:hypothetical protein DFH07DRAFT_813345 [Mycena maculata]